MAKTRPIFLGTVIWIALLSVAAGLPSRLQAARPKPAVAYRILVPEGYVGWIRIDFDVSGASPLPTEDGFYLFKIPKTGRFQTSSSDRLDSRRNEVFYYSDETKYLLHEGGPLEQQLVQVEFSGPGPGHLSPIPNRYRYIFIGPTDVFTKSQAADHSKDAAENDGYPKVGARYWLSRNDVIKSNDIKKFSRPTVKGTSLNYEPKWSRQVYQDDHYQFGFISSADSKAAPAFFAYDRVRNRWLHITEISTENAKFGKAFDRSSQFSLDLQSLTEVDYVRVPIELGDTTMFPDRITYQSKHNVYRIDCNSQLNLPISITSFWVLKSDLDRID